MTESKEQLIAIATFNELENLPDLVDQLFALIPKAHILIVDDNSPDGTPEWLARRTVANPKLHSMVRAGKLGLGSASREALQWAIEQKFTFVATMDADFSHDPADLPRLFAKANSTSQPDVVIGSRYTEGGKIVGWSRLRRISSRLINSHARIFLGLKTSDNSGAFRVYRTSVLRAMGTSKIRSSGYVYLQEILFLLKRRGATFAEVPIVFRDRIRGHSKINLVEAIKAVWKIAVLRFTVSDS